MRKLFFGCAAALGLLGCGGPLEKEDAAYVLPPPASDAPVAPAVKQDAAQPPDTRVLMPVAACQCDLDLSAVEETGVYPGTGSEVIQTIPGYGIYKSLCDVTADSQAGQVDLSYVCEPYVYVNPGSITISAIQLAWISVRRTFTALQDLSCCSAVSLQAKLDKAMDVACRCPRTTDADTTYDSGCCFSRNSLQKVMALRLTLDDIAAPDTVNQPKYEGWWYDFPDSTLDKPFDWTTLTAPISGFRLSSGGGTKSNNGVLDLANILAVEVNILVEVEAYYVAECTSSGCYPVDNYQNPVATGGISFRSIKTVCE
jgi:hypothetical protein